MPGPDGCEAGSRHSPFVMPWLSRPRWGLLTPCPFLTGKVQGLADSPSSPESPLSNQTEMGRSRLATRSVHSPLVLGQLAGGPGWVLPVLAMGWEWCRGAVGV